MDLHVAQLPPDLDVEWVVVPYASSDAGMVEQLARAALDRGGHVRVGIGDSPSADPDATNADLVERVVGWAKDAGRPVAEPKAVRARLGIG
jgi:uncharacterized protein (DUF849 family)